MSSHLYRPLVAALLVGEAALLAWNATRFDWLRGYDAYANDRYAEILWGEHRLPGTAETGVWHTPPLWFALAGALRALSSRLGATDVQLAGQLLSAAAGLGICVVVLLLARALWPDRRGLHVVALVAAAASPALVRASAMYHPETLAVALGSAGLLVAVRGLLARPTLATGLASGALLGLASLTRAWALPVLLVTLLTLAFHGRSSGRWVAPLAMLATAAALLAPWLVNQQLAHGSALAFNRQPPTGSIVTRRSAGFYLGPRVLRMFQEPVIPVHRNELLPQLYADWWGDWALTWDSPPPPAPGAFHAEGVVEARVGQLLVGLVPTLLALAGLVALAVLAAGRRSLAIGLLPLTSFAVAAAYVLFAVRYPSDDGDTLKGTYLLMTLPAAAVGLAFVVDVLRPRGRRWSPLVAAAVVVTVAVQLPFLTL